MYYYSKVNPLSLMGVTNSQNMLLSEKDLNAVEFNFLVKIHNNLESSISSSEEDQDQDQDQLLQDQFEMSSSSSSTMELIVPDHHHHENSNGFKTPSSLDKKIPAILKCPSAPRKPRPSPMKRRSSTAVRRRVFLDVAAEIESLFPPAILADLIGGKIKKLRQGSSNNFTLL